MKPVIGFIGLGNMGTPMAQNLLEAGYSLVVYDISEKTMEDLVKSGAESASSPREVARRSPVIITMLPGSAEVEAVVLGADGVIEGAESGSIVIDMSSSYPSSTRMISQRLAAKGIRMLDAPVSGGTRGAREGTLSILVGGNEQDYNECHPIFETMGKNIYYIGETGTGHAVKALNNLCSACSMVITSEVLVTATRLGLSPDKVIEVINASSGRSWSTQFKFPTFVLNDAFNSGFSINLMNKDLGIALDLGRELNIPMFVGAEVQQIYNHAVGRGYGEECHTAVVKVIEDWGGVKVRSRKS
ncbi:MAG: NAD(P)-dependent oxidoreductase [Dehalococcoidales bacterium]|nr:NAD(P)-dependent oxidoreductase [Dehalococcoidales bacterium]